MTTVVVGISDLQVSKNLEISLVTYALGSCIGVVIHDPAASVGGILHFMLPDSAMNKERAKQTPLMFADTGIPELFHAAYAVGADKRRIQTRLVGGAKIMNPDATFDIGKRNFLAARKILWRAGVMIHGEEVGGTAARSVRLEIGTGKLFWRRPGEAERELTAAARGPSSGKGVGDGI